MNKNLSRENEKLFLYGERILFLGFFLVAFILCGFISYTDGDDAYFSEMAHSMSLFEYLKLRYVGWEGRMTSEAMTYIAFYFGKGFWQLVNAVVLTLLPGGLLHILKKMSGALSAARSFLLALMVYALTLTVGVGVMGYGAFWVTGSTFYLWSIVAGIWGVMPFVDLVYRREQLNKRSFLYAIPCGFIAAMGQEQIAAVIITFGALAIGYDFWQKKEICRWAVIEEVIMIAALVVLFISPGTEARTQSEILAWMPQYQTMSLGNHMFITMQWMLSSFANEGKMLFGVLWLLMLLFWMQRKDKKGRFFAVLSFGLAVTALFPIAGISWLSQMGMGDVGMTQCVTQVATPASVSGQNWLAMIWWLGELLCLLLLLWQMEQRLRDKIVMCLILLAACASEGIMFFSPTMYASGPRVYFVAEILLWLLAGRLCGKLVNRQQSKAALTKQKEGRLDGYGYGALLLVAAAGMVNVLSEMSVVLQYL